MKTIKFKSLLYATAFTLFVGSTAANAANTYSGRAYVLQVTALVINLPLVDTGPMPSTGGRLDAGLPNIDVLGLPVDLIHARTKVAEFDGNGHAQAATSVARASRLDATLPQLPALPLVGNLNQLLNLGGLLNSLGLGNLLNLGGLLNLTGLLDVGGLLDGLIDANGLVVRARSKARCVNGIPQLIGRSTVANLTVLGVPINVTGAPNQTVPVLGLVEVIINEQIKNTVGNRGDVTVNAVHVKVIGSTLEVIIASAHSDITCD